MYSVRRMWAGMAWAAVVLGGAATVVLSGCGSTPLTHAPVEDRGSPAGGATAKSVPVGTDPRTAAVKQAPGFENAGKPGYYTVKPGDTLIRIGLESGQSYKDIARWNSLDNPNKIEVGQVLRIAPPAAPEGVSAKPVVAAGGTVTSLPPVGATPSTGAAAATAGAAGAAAGAAGAVVGGAGKTIAAVAPGTSAGSASTTPSSTAVATSAGASGDDDMGWVWPSSGAVIAGFDEAKNKGVDIAGSAGDAVLAAAEGKVVYAGAGLRGYGNLVILKHSNTFLTAYAHNQTLLVKEDQTVKKGQKIAEMGNSDADRVKLHFEVRKLGKPVDPTKYLPAR